MKKIMLIAVSLVVSGWLSAQNVTKLEYFFDTDPGYGAGTAVTISSPLPDIVDYTFSIPATSLSNGFHRLFIRGMDANKRWSLPVQRVIYKMDAPVLVNPYKVKRLEYFFDTDPGFGGGTALTVTSSEVVEDAVFSIPVSSLSDGFHKMFIRALDDKYSWSIAHSRIIYKQTLPSTATKNISKIEYFFDTDPGFGSGTAMTFTAGSDIEVISDVSLTGLAQGFHKIFIRAKDQNGAWSIAHSRSFYSDVIPNTVVPNLVSGEYFLDTDPGLGSGTAISFTSSTNVENKTFTVDLTGLTQGFHNLFIRFKDANNNWSHTINRVFYSETALDASIPNVTSAEYFIDEDPGYGSATAITGITAAADIEEVILNIPLNEIPTGFHKLYIRAKDSKNRWGQTLERSFYKDGSVPNFTAQISEIKYYVIEKGGALDLNAATPVADVTASEHIENFVFPVDLTGLEIGNYEIYAVAKDMMGQFSHLAVDSFKICDNVARANFTYEVASRTVTFTDLSELAATYYWTFGDGYTSEESNPVHTYSINGKFEVCQTVSNDCNASTFCDSVEVTYNAPPTSVSFNVNVDEDENYTFSYSTFNYYDEEGNAMDHFKITAMNLATGDSLILDGVSVGVDSIVPKADINKLVYKPATDQSGYRGSFNFRVHDGISYSNEYSVSLNVTAINDPATFTITNDAIVVVQNTSGTITIEDWLLDLDDGDPNENQTVQVSISIVDGNNLFSTYPSLGSNTDLTFSIYSDVIGMSNLKLIVYDYGTNPYSNYQEAEFTIEVKQFSAQLSTTTPQTCTGNEVIFTSTSPTYGITFEWDFGQGATPQTFDGPQPGPVVYSTSGVKSVKLKITLDGTSQTNEKTINVTVYSRPEASFLTGSSVFTLENDTVYFYNTSIGGSSYTWDFGDDSPTVTKTTTEMVKHLYSATANQSFTPSLNAVNGICTDFHEQTITFIDADPPVITQENFVSTYSYSQQQTVSVQAADETYGLKNAKFYYKSLSANQWNEKTLTSTTGLFETQIQETMGDQVGIQYFFDVYNNLGIKKRSTIGIAFLQFSNGLDLPAITFGTSVESYQIVSIPLTLENNAVETVFDELGVYDNTQWRLFNYNPSKLLEYPTDFQTIEKGKGYWLISRKQVTLNTGGGTTHSGTDFQNFKIALRQGWTQIGNPYIFNVSWADIEAANAAIVSQIGNLRVYNQGNFEDGTVLKTFSGGFVFADVAGLELNIPPTQSSSSKSEPAVTQEIFTSDSWKIDMKLAAKNLVTSDVGFGMNSEAKASKDKLDRMTTPRFLKYLEGNFIHPEFFYPLFATDIVPVSDNHIWDLSVETNLMGETVTLSWDSYKASMLTGQLKLVDTKLYKVIDMREVDSYTFQYNGASNLKILFGSQEFIESSLIFDQTVLGDCYPNPFNDHTIVPVFINGGEKEMSSIELSVYSIEGRKVATIANGEYSNGYHEFMWNVGSSQVGLKQGIYLYTLKNHTEGTTSTKRMVIIR